MKAIRAFNFKFVKGQTVFLTETEFGVSVTKMQILELIPNHEYTVRDPWGEYDDRTTYFHVHLKHGGIIVLPESVSRFFDNDVSKFISKLGIDK